MKRDRGFESLFLRRGVYLTGAFHGYRRKGPAFAGSVSRDACSRLPPPPKSLSPSDSEAEGEDTAILGCAFPWAARRLNRQR